MIHRGSVKGGHGGDGPASKGIGWRSVPENIKTIKSEVKSLTADS